MPRPRRVTKRKRVHRRKTVSRRKRIIGRVKKRSSRRVRKHSTRTRKVKRSRFRKHKSRGSRKVGYGKIKGHGSYVLGSRDGSQIPTFANGANYTRITFREYIGDVTSTLDFVNTGFAINAANVKLFPYLASHACSFENYRFQGLAFEFKSLSATALGATNSSLGFVDMATFYDSSLPIATSKMALQNTQFASSCVSSKDMMHFIECSRKETPITELYCDAGSQPPSSDPRMYNLGTFQIATGGFQQQGNIIGELWCSYVCDLIHPVVGFNTITTPTLDYLAVVGAASSMITGSTVNAGLFSSTSATLQEGSTHTAVMTNNYIQLPINMPVGNYLLQANFYNYSVSGTLGSLGMFPQFLVTGGGLPLNIYYDYSQPQMPAPYTTYNVNGGFGTGMIGTAGALGISMSYAFNIPTGNTAGPVFITTASNNPFQPSSTQTVWLSSDFLITALNTNIMASTNPSFV